MIRAFQDLAWKLWFPLALLILWQTVGTGGMLNPLFFPSPVQVGETIFRLAAAGLLGEHLAITLQRLTLGFLCGSLAGFLCAILAAISPAFSRSVEPTLAALLSIPKLTLLPLFVIVLGTGSLPRIVLVAIAVFLMISVETIAAIRAVDPAMIESARNYGARGFALVRHVYLPASLPRIFTAVRLAILRSTVLTITTEIVGARDGIGSLIWLGWQTMAVERIYVGVLISTLLGAVLAAGIRLAERRALTWMPALLFAFLPSLSAQTTASIEGRILDPSGAGVTGASIRVRHIATGSVRVTQSREDGAFRLVDVTAGAVQAEIAHPGFQPVTRTGLRAAAGASLWLEIQLAIRSSVESVTVESRQPLVNTNALDWGASQDQQRLESLPLNGRDLFSLANQAAGTNFNNTQSRSLTAGSGLPLSVNGARSNQNAFRLDGVYINDATRSVPGSASGRLLGLESVQELRLVTSPFSAEYGQAAGGVLTAVSKSGGNQFHGSAYEFFRNSALDSRNFFDAAKPPLRRNQFGAMASGPIRREHLFFLANYESLRDSTGRTARALTLSEAARRGVIGSQAPIAIPAAVRPFLDVFPAPNGVDFGDGSAELVASRNNGVTEHYGAAKIDWIPSEAFRILGRYTSSRAVSAVPEDLGLWNLEDSSRHEILNTEAQWIPSPRTLTTTRIGFTRLFNGELAASLDPRTNTLSFLPDRGLGAIRVTGLTDLGALAVRQRPRENDLRDLQFQQDLTHIGGPHSFKAGFALDLIRFNQVAETNKGGYYQFNSIASFLQGRATNVDVMTPSSDASRRWQQRIHSAFGQYQFRPNARFSIVAGVRWESYTVPSELDGKQATLRNPFSDAAITIGGPLFRNPSWGNFAPRLSIAWDPLGTGRTVIRAGFGQFFDLLGTREIVVAGVRVPPFFERTLITNPAFPNLAESLRSFRPDTALDMLDYEVRQPHVLQQQLEIQHEFPNHTVIRVGYAGSRGAHLPGQVSEFNSRVPVRQADGRLFFAANAPRQNPNFARISTRRTQFNSFYHALNVTVDQPFTRGLRGQFKYTFAKSIDEHSVGIFSEFSTQQYLPLIYNYRANRGPSNYNLRHAATANFTASTRRFTGWELHGAVTMQTGFPFTPSVGYDRAQIGGTNDTSQRPDFLANGRRVILGTPERWFDPEAFGLPEAGYYGTLGRNNFTGPGLVTLDTAVHKTVWRRESAILNLRVEAFNIANRTNLQIPSGLTLFNNRGERLNTAGRISSTATPSRQIQLALRLTF